MGKSSKSSSISTSNTFTTLETTTNQYDQRVAAADNAIAIAPGSSNISITQIPPEVSQGLIDLAFDLETRLADSYQHSIQDALSDTNTAVNTAVSQKQESDKTMKIVLIGIVAVAAVVLLMK